MNLSTIIQPCNDSGPFDPAFGSKFGIADYDWSNMKNVWVNTKPMDCEKLLVEQAQMNRKLNPQSRAFVYRNLVKALNWFGSVREKLDDPAYSGFFLKFDPTLKGKYHVPPCDESYSPPKCSVFYHDQESRLGTRRVTATAWRSVTVDPIRAGSISGAQTQLGRGTRREVNQPRHCTHTLSSRMARRSAQPA